ncbi:MAG: class I SAM-dependent methyltransferase [Acidimicrobiales bacterium]
MLRHRDLSASRTTPNDFAQRLFAPLPSRYDLIAAVLSFGQDRRWRRTMIHHVEGSKPALILDVACGPAGVTRALAKRTPARVIGVDLSEDMIRMGQANVARAGLSERVALVLSRGEQLPFADGTFDALTFTYLLRYVKDPQATLAELARVLKPGGAMASLEFSVPPGVAAHIAWWFYTRAVLPVAGFAMGGRGWWEVGRFLGPSISAHYKTYPIEWTVEAWRNAGLEHVEYRSISLGGGLVMWGYRHS